MDTPSRLTLRIFISSPGDVPVERDRAADVVARLQEEFVHYAVLEPFFWEDQPARATDTFQSQFPEASAMDIVVGILWARIGTPLPLDKARPDGRRYESGTVYELETAAESYRSRGTPDLVVYRRTSDPSLPLDDEAERQRRLEQLEALEAFIRRWFFHDDGSFKAAFHTFKTPDQFEQQLETHLRKLIREKVEKAEQPGGPAEGEIVFHGVPYPGLKVFGLEDAPVFYGRARALAAVKEALQAQAGRNCAFLLIFGMSGSGKSSLVRAGLLHALTATPGWIEGVDVWRWCVVRPGDATGDPLDALAQAFFGDTALPELRAGGIDAARLARTLRDNPDDVDLILGPALRTVAASEREHRAADRPLEVAAPGRGRPDGGALHAGLARRAGTGALRGRTGGAGAERAGVGGRHHAQRVLRAVRRAPRAGGTQGGPGSARPAAADLCRDRPDDPLPGARRRPALGEGPGPSRPGPRRRAPGSGLARPQGAAALAIHAQRAVSPPRGPHADLRGLPRARGPGRGAGQPCRGDARRSPARGSGRAAGAHARAGHRR